MEEEGEGTYLAEPDPEDSSAQPPCRRAGLGGGPWNKRERAISRQVHRRCSNSIWGKHVRHSVNMIWDEVYLRDHCEGFKLWKSSSELPANCSTDTFQEVSAKTHGGRELSPQWCHKGSLLAFHVSKTHCQVLIPVQCTQCKKEIVTAGFWRVTSYCILSWQHRLQTNNGYNRRTVTSIVVYTLTVKSSDTFF